MSELTLKQMAEKVRAAGQGDDIHLIHVNEEELAIIRETLGFDGSINPETGLVAFNPEGNDGSGGGSPNTYIDPRTGLPYYAVPSSDGSTTALVGPEGSTGAVLHNNLGYTPPPDLPPMPSSGEAVGATLALLSGLEGSIDRLIDRNIERFPRASQTALSTVLRDAPQINQFMQSALESSLDSLYPEWRDQLVGAVTEAQGDVNAISRAFVGNILPSAMQAADAMSEQMFRSTESLLRGEVPDDVAAELRRRNAEVSQQIGVRGQAAQYLTARDLGLTSLDMQARGAEMAPQALSLAPQAYAQFAQAAQMPTTAAANTTSVLNQFRAPQVDAGSMYGAFTGALSGSSMINPGAIMTSSMGTFGQMQANAMDAWRFQAERADNIWGMKTRFGIEANR